MSDIVERLRKAAADFEGMRAHSANALDSDCEPHWSDQSDMTDASKVATEAAVIIEALRAGRDAIRKATGRWRDARISVCALSVSDAGYMAALNELSEAEHGLVRSLSSPETMQEGDR